MSAAVHSAEGVAAPGASLVERARRIAREIAAKHADDVDRAARFPHEAVAALKEARLLGAMLPVELGGEGASLLAIADCCSTLAQGCAATAMIYAMHQIKVSSVLAHGLDSAWHRDFMRRIAAEQLLLASATTEAGIGGDLRNSICAVERTGERFRLEKAAIVISYGAEADAILATARRAPDASSSDQVLVPVLKGQYTLTKTNDWDTLGMRGTCSEGFRLVAEAPAEQILPKPFAEIAAQSMLATSHLLWSAVWLGIASDAVGKAQAFVRAEARKKPDTTPPGALRLAEAVSLLSQMKSSVLDGLRHFEAAKASPDLLDGMGFAVAMNNVKVGCSQLVIAIVQHALLVCGILGYKNGTPYSLGRHLRDGHSAQLMISNDRILGNTSRLLLMYKYDAELQGAS